MNLILFDDPILKIRLLPFTWIRPIAAIRIGILKIYEKWAVYFQGDISYLTAPYLSKKFNAKFSENQYYINGALCPSESLVEEIAKLKLGEGLKRGEMLLAYHTTIAFETPEALILHFWEKGTKIEASTTDTSFLQRPWDIFRYNQQEIISDFAQVTKGRESESISDPFTKVYHPENVFVEKGASIKAALINAENGPVYIGKNAIIHEGALVRGALALCENAEINMGAKIRGNSTFGPSAKMGGEINNAVVFGFSNKGHDGYLGNAVIGEWCNLGADTNNSNLKNNYSEVKVWDYEHEKLIPSGLQFCGLMMGDHSKCGINTMFNTGTVTGIAAIIFGGGFPQKFIPSFTWGGVDNHDTFQLEKMLELAENVMTRKLQDFTREDKAIFEYVFEKTSKYRQA